MGKKRVVKKQADTKKGGKQVKKTKKLPKIQKGRVYIRATYNNTIMTITNEKGDVIVSSSAGSLGFKGPKKATPFAATKVSESLSDYINKMGLKKVDVYVKGIGSGRESAIRSLPSQGLSINSIKDLTPVPHNGPRPPKPRRV